MGSYEGQEVRRQLIFLPRHPIPAATRSSSLRVTLSRRGWQLPAGGATTNCDISADPNTRWFLPSMPTEGLKVWDFEILRQSSADEPRDLPRPYSSSSTSTVPSAPRMLTFSTIGSPNRGLPGLHLLQLWDRRQLTSCISCTNFGFTLPSYPANIKVGCGSSLGKLYLRAASCNARVLSCFFARSLPEHYQ